MVSLWWDTILLGMLRIDLVVIVIVTANTYEYIVFAMLD